MTEEIKQEPVVQQAQQIQGNTEQPQAVPSNQEQPVSPAENVPVEQKPPEKPKNDVDLNWKKAREIMKAQSFQISELKKDLENVKKPPDKGEFDGIDKDDFVTFEQAQRLAEKNAGKMAHDVASKVVDERLQIIEGERLEDRTRAKLQDYDYVVENFALPMIEKNPALAQAIKSSPNWPEMAYRLAKATPEYEAEIAKRQQSQSQQEVDKVLKDQERPLASNAAGSSLKSQVEQFAAMSPEEVWQKAKEYAKKAC